MTAKNAVVDVAGSTAGLVGRYKVPSGAVGTLLRGAVGAEGVEVD